MSCKKVRSSIHVILFSHSTFIYSFGLLFLAHTINWLLMKSARVDVPNYFSLNLKPNLPSATFDISISSNENRGPFAKKFGVYETSI